MKLARVQLGPGGAFPRDLHEHDRHDLAQVLIALDAVELNDESEEGNTAMRLASGDAVWYTKNSTHQPRNADKQEAAS